MPLPRYPENDEEILLLEYHPFGKFISMRYRVRPTADEARAGIDGALYDCVVYETDSLFYDLQRTIGEDIATRRLRLPIWIRMFFQKPFRYSVAGYRLDDWGIKA